MDAERIPEEPYINWRTRTLRDIPLDEVRLSGYRTANGVLQWMEAVHLPSGELLGRWEKSEQ